MGKAKIKLTKKQVLSGVGVVGLLLLAVAAGFLMQQITQQQQDPAQQGPTDNTPPVVTEIQELRLQGDAKAVEQKINEELSKGTTTDETRYMLYIQQGNSATDSGNWRAAIDPYLKAEALKQTYEITSLLGDTYRQVNDSQKAIEYYKKAIPLIPDTPVKDDERESLENKIRALGGQV